MTTIHIAAGRFVKVAVGSIDGNRVARILRKGEPVPDGVDADLLDNLVERGLLTAVEIADPVVDELDDRDLEDTEGEELYPEGQPSKEWSEQHLDAYATKHGVDLKGKTTKATKLAAILAAAQ
jgi:hypothetical protein